MAKAQSQQAQAQLQSARTNLSYTVLRSPSDGVVGSLPFRVGDFVGPSTQSGLTTVADAHEMYVYFSLTERDIPITRPENYKYTPEEIALMKKQAREAYLKWVELELEIAKYNQEQTANNYRDL